jgi:glycosyltransferase involved in cell wall biosynthesis
MSSPMVTVIIPAYNAAGHIAGAVESALAQEFKTFEVVVVNDGSPDTEALEQALAPYRDRIRYLVQENGGPSAARNLGLRAAQSEFIAFLDSDDIWLPRFLAVVVPLLQEDPNLSAAYANAWIEDEAGMRIGTFMDSAPSEGPVTFESLLRWRCSVITSGTVARRQALVDAGFFAPEFRRSEDFHLWARVLHGGRRMAYTREVLLVRNVSAEGLSADYSLMLEGQLSVYAKLLGELPLSADEGALLRDRMRTATAMLEVERGKAALRGGRGAQAKVCFRAAYSVIPSGKLLCMIAALAVAPKLLPAVLQSPVAPKGAWSRIIRPGP